MNINHIAGCSEILGAPKGWDPKIPCGGLPVRYETVDGMPCVVSSWQPTNEELLLILAGHPILLWVAGTTTPPVSIQVGDPLAPATEENPDAVAA